MQVGRIKEATMLQWKPPNVITFNISIVPYIKDY